MSIKVMNLVWENGPEERNQFMVLLALADWADDKGRAYPAIETLAKKSRLSVRTVQETIAGRAADGKRAAGLVASGLLTVDPNAGPRGVNRYCINLAMLREMGADAEVPSEERGAKSAGVQSSRGAENADKGCETRTQSAPEPSGTIMEPSQDAQARERDEMISEELDRRSALRDDRRAFQGFVNNWPGFAGMSLESAKREFAKLDDEDRSAAIAMRDHWIATLRKQGKDHTPAPSTYLKERLWETVPAPAMRNAERVLAPAYGKAWTHHVLTLLARGPGKLPPAPAYIAKLIEAGGAVGRRELRERQAKYGWPEVNRIVEAANDGKPASVPAEEADALPPMEALAVDSAAYDAWRCAFSDRGWPWIKPPRSVRYVWFPADGPQQLAGGGGSKVGEAA
jgi:hypothetical protein